MQSKFRFSLDGVDATARQFSDIRRQLRELPASIDERISRLGRRIADVESDLASLTTNENESDVGGSDMVEATAYGGTGVRNVFGDQLSSLPRKTAYCLYDGTLGVDCSSAHSAADVGDGVPTGVDYPKLSVAALRLAQEAMDEVDGLKAAVGQLSAKIDKIEETYAKKSIDEE